MENCASGENSKEEYAKRHSEILSTSVSVHSDFERPSEPSPFKAPFVIKEAGVDPEITKRILNLINAFKKPIILF